MLTRKQFIEANFDVAKRITSGTNIFPETLLAIAVIESQAPINGTYYPGASVLAKKANNFFGIKSSAAWNGKTIKLSTPSDAEKVSTFRVYNSFQDSAKDFIKFLMTNKRYVKGGIFTAPDYTEQIKRIAASGYAENESYSNLVLNVANSVSKTISKIVNKHANKLPIILIGFFFSLILLNNTKNAKLY